MSLWPGRRVGTTEEGDEGETAGVGCTSCVCVTGESGEAEGQAE